VLKSKSDERRDGTTSQILAWTGVGGSGERKRSYDPAADASLGAGRRVSAFRRPSWSEDGSVIFAGVAPWAEKPAQAKSEKKDEDTGDKSTVDVWHPRDVDVMPKQKVGASRDRQRTLLAAWPLDRATLTVLGQDYGETVVPLKAKNLAYVVSWTTSALDRSWGRFGSATLSLVDVLTGERTKVGDASTIASSARAPRASTSSITPAGITGRWTPRAARPSSSPRASRRRSRTWSRIRPTCSGRGTASPGGRPAIVTC
jgi:hypothetical protein